MSRIYGSLCRSIFNHCDIIGLQSYRIRRKKRKIRAITPFKVIQVSEVGTNRKPVCDILLVTNSKRHPISHHLGIISAYCSNFGYCVFQPPFEGLATTYDVHLGLIGKRAVHLLLVTSSSAITDRAAGWVSYGKVEDWNWEQCLRT